MSGVFSGLALFAALMAWLNYHGYFISPDAIYINILAKSFWAHPYVIWFKRAYSYPFEIIHPDFNFPFLPPLMHWALGAIGITSWHRGNWITAFFMGMTVPAWIYALAPHFENPDGPANKRGAEWWIKAVIAGWAATLILLAQAYNQLWHELYLGIVSPIAVFLFLLSYGAYMRGRYILCGTLTGLAFLFRFDAQVTLAILVLGHLITRLDRKHLKRTVRECFEMGLPFFAVTSVWWVRAMLHGFPPWFNHMVPIFLYGEAGNFRWFPDTDTAIGHAIPNGGQPSYPFYEQLVRNRYYDLITPYVGAYASEVALLGTLIFLGFLYALHRPRQRPLVAFVWLGAILRVSVVAGLHDSFNRRYFLIFDATAITWITLMLWDANRWIRTLGRVLVVMLVATNWGELTNVLKSMRPYVGYLEGGSPMISEAVAQSDVTREPVLANQIEGHAIAYFTDGIPIIEMPTNFADDGLMDQYLDRWKIRWVTDGAKIKAYLKTHELTETTSAYGIKLFKVGPVALKPPAAPPAQAPAPKKS